MEGDLKKPACMAVCVQCFSPRHLIARTCSGSTPSFWPVPV